MLLVIAPPCTPRAIYRSHENMKKLSYQARIHEMEHGTFTHLVFSATGRMSDEAYAFYKYRIDLNFGGAKLWRIDSISPNLTLQFFKYAGGNK